MKSIFLALTMLTGIAHAGTVTLSPSPCANAYDCYSVPNSAGDTISYITFSPHYGRLLASINGVIWDSGLWALGSYNGNVQPTETLTAVPLSDGEGHTIYLSVSFAGGEQDGPCVREGRVTVCPKAPVSITAGTITGL